MQLGYSQLMGALGGAADSEGVVGADDDDDPEGGLLDSELDEGIVQSASEKGEGSKMRVVCLRFMASGCEVKKPALTPDFRAVSSSKSESKYLLELVDTEA